MPHNLTPEQHKQLVNSGVPVRYQTSRLDNYYPIPENRGSFEKLQDAARRILQGEPINLILAGSVGSGKTHLACALTYYFLSHGFRCWFIEFNELMSGIRQGKNQPWEDDRSEIRLRERAKCSRVLMLDDVGVNWGSSWDQQVLDDAVNARYSKMLPTIITTNLSLGALEKLVGERTMDRLTTSSDSFLTFVGTSQRRG